MGNSKGVYSAMVVYIVVVVRLDGTYVETQVFTELDQASRALDVLNKNEYVCATLEVHYTLVTGQS